MVQHDSSTIFARFGGLFIFLSMTTVCFVWFAWSIYSIANQITTDAHVVYFDKGSLYMLGAGIGLSALTFAILYEGILRRNLTKRVTKIITKSALAGIILMFLLPQLLHYLTNTYLTEKRYIVCVEASYQWLFYKKIVYTDIQSTCEALNVKKK